MHDADSAMLVRGEDLYGHFEVDPEPVADLDAAAIAAPQAATERVRTYLYQGGDEAEKKL